MNARLTLSQIATRLDAQLNTDPNAVQVQCATAYDRSYLDAYGKTYPAVWVLAQRLSPKDDGRGYSGRLRQGVLVDIAVRVVVQRYADGVMDGELALNDLHDRVAAALIGYAPTSADFGLAWAASQDGPASETLMVLDMVFQTETTYQRSNSA